MSRYTLQKCLLAALALLSVTVLGDDKPKDTEWHLPPKDALIEIIKDPARIRDHIASTTVNQTASIMIAAVGIMEEMKMSDDEIADTLTSMLNQATIQRGEAFGARVMVILRKKVNPRLLPVIPVGTTPGGGGKRYPRQSAA